MAMLENEKPIRQDKLHDQVFERLCVLLRQGEFTPGEAVAVARISEAFGVSAMPVREALTRLLAVGALTNVSGRSVGVPRLGRDELTDLRDVRLEIETTAMRWAVAKASKGFLLDLEGILAEMRRAESSGAVRDYIRGNYEFHFRIYAQAGSDVLNDIIGNLWLRVSPHLYHLDRDRTIRISNVHHEEMIEAIRTGDAEMASRALVADISGAYEDLVSALFADAKAG
ncbi:MAG: GntR family transcriptional regulator [Pseudomonadota bacterium]